MSASGTSASVFMSPIRIPKLREATIMRAHEKSYNVNLENSGATYRSNTACRDERAAEQRADCLDTSENSINDTTENTTVSTKCETKASSLQHGWTERPRDEQAYTQTRKHKSTFTQ